MNQEIKQKWVEALRSGKYNQGQGYLRKGNNYCCLGVLCDLHDDKEWIPSDHPTTPIYNLSIVDLENVQEEYVRYYLENVKYLDPSVISLETRDIKEWDDDHPLNQKDTFKEEFERLFNGNN